MGPGTLGQTPRTTFQVGKGGWVDPFPHTATGDQDPSACDVPELTRTVLAVAAAAASKSRAARAKKQQSGTLPLWCLF
jgi:hypothetical protein